MSPTPRADQADLPDDHGPPQSPAAPPRRPPRRTPHPLAWAPPGGRSARCAGSTTEQPCATPPPAAIYYPAAVCFGHRYEAVLEGSVNEFTAGVKASFLIFSAGLDAFAAQHRLKLDIKADGLRGWSLRGLSSISTSE